MAFEFGAIAPWLDNWGIQRQLWNPGAKAPGNELALVPTNRNLTVQWRDVTNTIVLAFNEFQLGTPIKILNASRGVVEIALTGDQWNVLKEGETYTCEILAYGYLYDSFLFNMDLPATGQENLSGVEVYGAPREILELLSEIPGASVSVGVDLSAGWVLNAQGYWTRTIDKTRKTYGLWINDLHARQVPYELLALGSDRQFARVSGSTTDTLYYKGKEPLNSLTEPMYVETAFNRYVLRCLEEATTELERGTGTFFNRQRVYREVHRGKYRQNQVSLRARPVEVDRYFRLDCYNRSRTLVRRYTEDSVFSGKSNAPNNSTTLFVEGETGIVTLTDSFWDWASWGSDVDGLGLRGLASFTPGDVSLELTYTGGYDYIPTDISEAVGNMAAIRQLIYWERAMSQGLQGINIGCVKMDFPDSKRYQEPWQQSANAIIDSYRRVEIEAF